MARGVHRRKSPRRRPSIRDEGCKIQDGCHEFHIFWRIILPLVKPALATLAIFTFLWSWDSFLWPIIVVDSEKMRTLPIGMALFRQTAGVQIIYNQLMAIAILGMIPVLAVFVALQRYFVQGIVMSGLKG
ncbi:MAG: carbohydrate ABC transporter permease [bacterium]